MRGSFSSPTITGLFTFPVKGLNGQPLDEAQVAPGGTVPWDRAFALAPPGCAFDPEAPRYLPKTEFLVLLRHERLALLEARFDAQTVALSLLQDGRVVAEGVLDDANLRAPLELFLSEFLISEAQGPVRILGAPGHSMSDVPVKVVSLINLASVRELEEAVGGEVDPLRFRGNVLFDGAAPWAEFGWVDCTFRAGGAVLKGVKPIERCGATNVNLATAARDMNIPKSLAQHFGHIHMGLYAEVVKGGVMAPGDSILVE